MTVYFSIHKCTKHTTSARAEITFPSVVRDLLMFAPSCKNKEIKVSQTLLSNHLYYYMCFYLLRVCRNTIKTTFKQRLHLTFSLVPLAPVESALSLPAKSTRLILLTCDDMKHLQNKMKNMKHPPQLTCLTRVCAGRTGSKALYMVINQYNSTFTR